jgi:hypothetical protein
MHMTLSRDMCRDRLNRPHMHFSGDIILQPQSANRVLFLEQAFETSSSMARWF